jgi:hypothetical protein
MRLGPSQLRPQAGVAASADVDLPQIKSAPRSTPSPLPSITHRDRPITSPILKAIKDPQATLGWALATNLLVDSLAAVTSNAMGAYLG